MSAKQLDFTRPIETRAGKKVVMVTHNPDAKEYCRVGAWIDGALYAFQSDGSRGFAQKTTLDLIQVTPYKGFKKDDCVRVRNKNSLAWTSRHFSHEEGDRAWCFSSGKTSHTAGSKSDCFDWDYCEKVDKPEGGEWW